MNRNRSNHKFRNKSLSNKRKSLEKEIETIKERKSERTSLKTRIRKKKKKRRKKENDKALAQVQVPIQAQTLHRLAARLHLHHLKATEGEETETKRAETLEEIKVEVTKVVGIKRKRKEKRTITKRKGRRSTIKREGLKESMRIVRSRKGKTDIEAGVEIKTIVIDDFRNRK